MEPSREKTMAVLCGAEGSFSMWCKALSESISPGKQNLELVRTLCIRVASKCDEIILSRQALSDMDEEEVRENVQ